MNLVKWFSFILTLTVVCSDAVKPVWVADTGTVPAAEQLNWTINRIFGDC